MYVCVLNHTPFYYSANWSRAIAFTWKVFISLLLLLLLSLLLLLLLSLLLHEENQLRYGILWKVFSDILRVIHPFLGISSVLHVSMLITAFTASYRIIRLHVYPSDWVSWILLHLLFTSPPPMSYTHCYTRYHTRMVCKLSNQSKHWPHTTCLTLLDD